VTVCSYRVSKLQKVIKTVAPRSNPRLHQACYQDEAKGKTRGTQDGSQSQQVKNETQVVSWRSGVCCVEVTIAGRHHSSPSSATRDTPQYRQLSTLLGPVEVNILAGLGLLTGGIGAHRAPDLLLKLALGRVVAVVHVVCSSVSATISPFLSAFLNATYSRQSVPDNPPCHRPRLGTSPMRSRWW
jgi:hypothetical protein